MSILLLGHRGYLGRSLFAYLKKRHNVMGWDKEENLFKLNENVLADNGINLIVNLAVMADRQSKRFVVDGPTDEVNVKGARHLFNLLKGSEIGWIQLSTREVLGPVYGANDIIKTDDGFRPKFLVAEDAPFAPWTCYGKSKIMAEFIAESYPKSNIIRLTTCYTDFDHPGGNWMVQLTRQAINKMPIRLTQGGLQFRDPLHVDDLGRLIERIHDSGVTGEVFHAGAGNENLISLREFVTRIDPKAQIESAEGGDYGFAFDGTKAEKCLGWKPTILVREKIPVITKNIGEKISEPPGLEVSRL